MILLILCCFYTIDFYPQRGDEEIGWGVGEIYIGTRGLDEEEFVYYKMETIGAFYGGGPLISPSQPFTMNNPSIYQNAMAHYISGYQIIQEISNTNFSLFNWPYFRMIFLDDGGSNSFGYGIYKLFIEPYSAYFYIDYRDTDYGSYTNCNGHCQDTWLKYERSLNKFYYKPGSNGANNPDDENWIPIENGEVLFHYEIKMQSNPSTAEFPDFWQNCLVVIPSPAGNQPRLVWGPHPNSSYNSGFNVYRAVVSPGQPEPAEGNFALLTPNGLSNSTFTYTDGDINLGTNNNSLVYYFVKAKGSGSTLSSKTNTVDIDGRYIEIEKKKGNEEIGINNFSLSQNHPNPFNPTTSIVYQIATSGIVNLSVYNLLGEKVAMLVNDYKEAGEYTVQFNASGLPSGTYIYTLATNGNRISKKLSVMK